MITAHAHVDDLVAHLTARDADAARELVLDLADRGVPVVDLLTELLGPAQAEVGLRWQRAAFSVADEHAATAIVDSVVSVLGAHAPPVRVDGPHVAVVCAEGEWHLLPARLVAEVLRSEGFRVTFLGASMPPPHLARFLQASPPDVLAVSCTTPMSLEGVLLCAEVAHDAGVPVLVGGSALGPDDRRARVLGADLWAPDARTATELLRAPLPPAGAVATADVRGASDLAQRRDEIVERTVVRMQAELPAYAGYDESQRRRTREDLGYLIDFARAAVLTRDPRVLLDVLPWLEVILDARGISTATFHTSLRLLAETSGHSGLVEMLARAQSRG
ncbi:MAG: B12-binding domain-containing protein [Acidimicrobiia bacterium]